MLGCTIIIICTVTGFLVRHCPTITSFSITHLRHTINYTVAYVRVYYSIIVCIIQWGFFQTAVVRARAQIGYITLSINKFVL